MSLRDTPPKPMRIDRASPAYRKAFEAYMRYGEPIDLRQHHRVEAKAGNARDSRPTTHYIWRGAY